jgi:hypothetical protein
MRKPIGLGMACSIPPNLNAKTLVPEKQNHGKENYQKIETKINHNKMNYN